MTSELTQPDRQQVPPEADLSAGADDPAGGNLPAEVSDEVLDAMLNRAQWPQVSATVIERLQSVFDAAVDDSVPQPLVTSVRPVNEIISSRNVRLQYIAAMVLMLMAFLAGRWSVEQFGSRQTEGAASNPSLAELTLDGVSPGQISTTESVVQNSVDAALRSVVAVENGGDSSSSGMPESGMSSGVSVTELPMPVMDEMPDDASRKRRRPNRVSYREQLDAVLTCLAEQEAADVGCVQPLLLRRSEFEYLLWEVIQNSTGQKQLTALTAMGFVGSRRSVPLLMKTSASNDQALRAAAIAALKRCADEQTLAGFVLQQQRPELAFEFAAELANRRSEMALQTWFQLVQNPASRMTCLRVSDDLNPELVEMLFAALDASLVADRVSAAISLGSRTDKQTQQRLRGLVQQFPLRWEPVAALIWNGSSEAMQLLSQLQQDQQRFAVLQTAAVQLSAYTKQTSAQTSATSR
jgi:hypothetical protein